MSGEMRAINGAEAGKAAYYVLRETGPDILFRSPPDRLRNSGTWKKVFRDQYLNRLDWVCKVFSTMANTPTGSSRRHSIALKFLPRWI